MTKSNHHLVQWLMLLLAVFLAGCGSSGSQPTTAGLPLDGTRPTFLFFYTDN